MTLAFNLSDTDKNGQETNGVTLDAQDRRLLQERLIESAYNHLNISVLGIIVNAIVLTYALWDLADNTLLSLWFSLIAGVSLWRFLSARAYRKARAAHSAKGWQRRFYAGVILSSLLWGSAALLFFIPHQPMQQAILLIIFAGLSAGAISSLSPQLAAIRIFFLLMLGPLMLQLFWQGNPLHTMIALLLFLFTSLLLVVSKRYYKTLVTSLSSALLFQKAQEQLLLSEKRFSTIFREAPAGLFFYDNDLRIIESNPAFAEILKAPLERVVGLDMHTLPDTRLMPTLAAVLDGLDGFYEGAYHTKLSDMDLWITLRTTPVANSQGDVIGGIGIVTDITERMKAEQKIRRQAYYDTLTDIPNRATLMERLKEATARYKRHNNIAALLFLDLDHFKKINDSLGHHTGDEMLKETAKRLQSVLREEDLVCRLGGDEFVILLQDLGNSLQEATAKAEVIAQKVHTLFETPFDVQGQILKSSTSIGIAMTDSENDRPEDLLKHADTAMYQAKKEGRGTTSFYQVEMDRWIKQRLQLENDLRGAIENNMLELYYQPVVEFATKRIIGAEALLRWEHPALGLIHPEEIVSLAEETGLIVPLGEWVLDRACMQLKRWRECFSEEQHFRKLAVNVSTLQFNQSDYVGRVHRIIKAHGIDPAMLTLELTESIIIDKVEDTVAKMRQLRELGIGIAIDDFGTGYSSLSYLKQLPFSELKIDRSFTQDLEKDADDAMLIETIIAIAKKFKLHVVAEGVETYEQYCFLYEHHCHTFQGYLCSPPLNAQKFTELLMRHEGSCPDFSG